MIQIIITHQTNDSEDFEIFLSEEDAPKFEKKLIKSLKSAGIKVGKKDVEGVRRLDGEMWKCSFMSVTTVTPQTIDFAYWEVEQSYGALHIEIH